MRRSNSIRRLSAILQCADEISTTLSDFRATGSRTIADSIVSDSIDAAQTIALCAQHQKRIVDDVLTLSKLDSAMLMVRHAAYIVGEDANSIPRLRLLMLSPCRLSSAL
jgi:hypothetical protein